jgi:ABC-type Na+ efflux pump permease subunit
MDTSRFALTVLFAAVPATGLFIFLRRTSMKDHPIWQPAALCLAMVVIYVGASLAGAASSGD